MYSYTTLSNHNFTLQWLNGAYLLITRILIIHPIHTSIQFFF